MTAFNPLLNTFIHSVCNFFFFFGFLIIIGLKIQPHVAYWSSDYLSTEQVLLQNANRKDSHLDSQQWAETLRAEAACNRTPLLLKEVFCFFQAGLFFAQEKAHLQLSVGAADFISLFIIHYSYELYFRSCRPSYIPAKDTFSSSLCAAKCDGNEKWASCAGRGSRRDFAAYQSVWIFFQI